jgi:hypothetical protein
VVLRADRKWSNHTNFIIEKASKHVSVLRKLKFRMSRKFLEKNCFYWDIYMKCGIKNKGLTCYARKRKTRSRLLCFGCLKPRIWSAYDINTQLELWLTSSEKACPWYFFFKIKEKGANYIRAGHPSGCGTIVLKYPYTW